jgi:hypothetical protein
VGQLEVFPSLAAPSCIAAFFYFGTRKSANINDFYRACFKLTSMLRHHALQHHHFVSIGAQLQLFQSDINAFLSLSFFILGTVKHSNLLIEQLL